jgi:hypothetical protein
MTAQTISIVLGGVSAITAVVAAALWFVTARVTTPNSFSIFVARANGSFGKPLGDPLGGTYVGHAYSEDLNKLADALRRQSRLSAWAAVFAGIAAFSQTGSLIAQLLATAT